MQSSTPSVFLIIIPIVICIFIFNYIQNNRRNASFLQNRDKVKADKKRKAEADEKHRVEAQRKFKASVAKQREAAADRERKAEPDRKHSTEAYQKHEEEAKRQREAEAKRQRKAEAVYKHRAEVAERDAIEAAKKQRKEDEERELEAEKLAQQITTLKSNLPFYISNKTPSTELADHDKNMWEDVTKLVKEQDSTQTTLYFVKIRSLLDDNEYYKIGITTAGIKARFKKSTQVELLETVCSFDTELWKAAYLEYHFLREFRLYDGLASSLGELRPEVGFSGYTEVVRSNSVNKISEFFGELDVYNELS